MKVLLVVIDALASRVVKPAIEEGRLPTLRLLSEQGQIRWDSTAIFPSITPAATATLITGGYPAQTGITGAYFYDTEKDRVHFYGDDIWAILNKGYGNYVEDFLVGLNNKRLQAETVYQAVERGGGTAACLNYLWYHGDQQHTLHVPWLLRLGSKVKDTYRVQGPRILALGDFVTSVPASVSAHLRGRGGFFHRFGFADVTTSHQLLALAHDRNLPDFTVAYFPDNDFQSHKQGPDRAIRTVERVDRTLGKLLKLYGGVEALLEEVAVIVTGDHAQSDLTADRSALGISLPDVLSEYQVVPPGQEWSRGDELMVCPNMRAAQIYLRPDYWHRRAEIIASLLQEKRIDQVIWREPEGEAVAKIHVATADRGTFEFWPGEAPTASAYDEYGAAWNWSGDLRAIDATLTENHQFRFRDYPNALERIANAFDNRMSGDLWLTCRPGYEFRTNASFHFRGSHGSLYVEDSHSPLILAGCDRFPTLSRTPRAVDIAPLCHLALGLPSQHLLGAPRANPAIGADAVLNRQ